MLAGAIQAQKGNSRSQLDRVFPSPIFAPGLQLILDFRLKRASMEISPPIRFRIEWADSQEKSPLLGCRPILIEAGRGTFRRQEFDRYFTTNSRTLRTTDCGASASISTTPSL